MSRVTLRPIARIIAELHRTKGEPWMLAPSVGIPRWTAHMGHLPFCGVGRTAEAAQCHLAARLGIRLTARRGEMAR